MDEFLKARTILHFFYFTGNSKTLENIQ